MRPYPPLRILIADDNALVREGIVALLSLEHTIVAQACNGQEAVALYRSHLPDITLMDLRMPVMDGLTAIRAILVAFPSARILVFTTFDGEEENAHQAGAKAVILKEAPYEELVAAIHAVYDAA